MVLIFFFSLICSPFRLEQDAEVSGPSSNLASTMLTRRTLIKMERSNFNISSDFSPRCTCLLWPWGFLQNPNSISSLLVELLLEVLSLFSELFFFLCILHMLVIYKRNFAFVKCHGCLIAAFLCCLWEQLGWLFHKTLIFQLCIRTWKPLPLITSENAETGQWPGLQFVSRVEFSVVTLPH